MQNEGQRNAGTKLTELDILLEKTSIYTSFLADKLRQHDLAHGSSSQADSQRAITRRHSQSRFTQPASITGGKLKQYQLEGVEWLASLYENGLNGILADEMGLGKTIQCIAFLAFLMERGVDGPFLVVAPLSTLSNWQGEFKRFAPTMHPLLYHGSKGERPAIQKQFMSASIVITSYEMCMMDERLFRSRRWKFIIVDEGHRLKNMECKLIRTLKRFDTANRLLLTGTPLQNKLSELWSLLNFLLPSIFDDLEAFQEWFDTEEIAEKAQPVIVSKLHAILRPFLLRRLKADVEQQLPPKREYLVEVGMTALQREYYQAALERRLNEFVARKHGVEVMADEGEEGDVSGRGRKRTRTLVDASLYDFPDQSRDSKHLTPTVRPSPFGRSFQNLLMQLRKCCNHPYLFYCPPEESFRVVEDSGKMIVLMQLLHALQDRQHRTLVFSQMSRMLDLVEDALEEHGMAFCRIDGSFSQADRQAQIDEFNGSDVPVFLLSTRAGGLGLNLVAADTVILYDSDWNPQMDLQAQDRVHRIGQTRPVLIYRLSTTLSVESLMLDRAARKRRLERLVIARTKFKGGKQLLGEGDEVLDEELIREDARLMFGRTSGALELDAGEIEGLMDRSPGVFVEGVEGGRGRIKVIEGHHSAVENALTSQQ